MAPSKPTPEEKLFAVIQGKPGAHPRSRAQALALRPMLVQWLQRLGAVDLNRVNQLLLGVAAVLLVLAVLQPLVLRPHVGRLLAEARTHGVPFIMPPPLEGLRPTEAYLQIMQLGDPFHLAPTPLEVPAAAPQAPSAPDAQALLSDLRLVGIAWGEEPTAMIEQSGAGQTHFLKAGEQVGPFTIKEILEDRVILLYGSQDIELF